jgi:hypothetical protein
MLIATRFADVPQVHVVKMPGGTRTQLTFFPDRVAGAHYGPEGSDYFTFVKDVGGGEWFQNRGLAPAGSPIKGVRLLGTYRPLAKEVSAAIAVRPATSAWSIQIWLV